MKTGPYLKELAALKHEVVKSRQVNTPAKVKALEKEIKHLMKKIPHKINGRPLKVGMKKPGLQSHVHIIVSRKDASNRYSLSPGSRYKTSETKLHGKMVKRGFDRDKFYENAEKTFDKLFGYNRNYTEYYKSRKTLQKNSSSYYRNLKRLPIFERQMAFQMLREAGIFPPAASYTPAQVRIALKQFKRALDIAQKASSIHY